MKNVLITTAAAALLLASQGAIAQPQNRGDGPGAGPQAPGPGTSGPPAQSGPSAGPSSPPASPPARAPGPGATPDRGNSGSGPRAEQPQRPPQKQAQPQAQQPKSQQKAEQKSEPKAQQKAEQKSEPKAEPKRTGESKQPPTPPRADAKGKDADQNRTARDANPKANGKADAKDTAGKDADRGKDAASNKDADRSKDKNRSDTAQGKADAKDKAQGDRMAGTQDLRQARERLDAPERTRLHSAFDRRSAKTNIRVNVRIGGRVPRNVHLVRVPQTVISFFPYYRDYSYFVVDETVYIVNPRSYEVVDVIDEGYGRGQPVQQARLTLTDRQITMVQDVIASLDIRAESLRLRLALGAEIPRDVELHRFPARVLDNVRDLENYRYVLVEDQIVIVKPDDRSIALVIDRT